MLILFNKPYGVISQFTEQVAGQQTLMDFDFPENVYPLGRLDMDSEGLLLLTDEAEWNDRLLNPRNAHERTYHVQVEGNITEDALRTLRKGVRIQDWKTKPCRAAARPDLDYPPRLPPIRYRKSVPDSWMELRLIEGKNRQVRRMTAAVGFPTLRLIRAGMGALTLGDLLAGEWRVLNPSEKRLLLKNEV